MKNIVFLDALTVDFGDVNTVNMSLQLRKKLQRDLSL
jgi:hypothetical protein